VQKFFLFFLPVVFSNLPLINTSPATLLFFFSPERPTAFFQTLLFSSPRPSPSPSGYQSHFFSSNGTDHPCFPLVLNSHDSSSYTFNFSFSPSLYFVLFSRVMFLLFKEPLSALHSQMMNPGRWLFFFPRPKVSFRPPHFTISSFSIYKILCSRGPNKEDKTTMYPTP